MQLRINTAYTMLDLNKGKKTNRMDGVLTITETEHLFAFDSIP